jgi:uncharacterized membrane protein YphA (DoxX/SURF4 family)
MKTTKLPSLPSLSEQTSNRVRNATIGVVRILVGLMWLANIEWKRPSDFGQHQKNGLYKYVDAAISHRVFGPWSWIVEHIVLKQYTLFGWSTLLLESTLAAMLLLGLWTRPVAMIGAANSVAIALSVLHYPNEWPWSYYLMIGAHLLLAATGAGRYLGLDGVRKAGGAARAKAVTVLGAIAFVVGVVGVIRVSGSTSFTSSQGGLVGWAGGEAKLLWFNPLSALLTAVLGVAAVLSVRLRKPVLGWVAMGGFALMALQVLAQWRYRDGNWTGGILGGTGATMAFWAMFAVGLLACRPMSSTVAPAPAH